MAAARSPGEASLDAVVIRAAIDASFREWLLADPHRAIQETFGLALPKTLRLKFIEKGKDVDLLVVLPDIVE